MNKLLVERENGIVRIVINREEKHNAIDYDVMNRLKISLDEIEDNNEDKLLVIRGAGEKTFCSGGDLSIFHELYTKEEAYEMLSKMGEILYRLFFFPKPTVAALNGTAVGGGCEIATACDFRIAASHAKIGFIQGKLGITTGWGASTLIQQRLSPTVAFQMLMTAKRYTATEASEIGFIQQIINHTPFNEGCNLWLNEFINQNSAVLNAYKQRWLDNFDKVTLKHRIQRESEACAELWATDEHHEAVNQFLKKKK